MLDAPPMLAPGPHVTGAGSAAVRLKQLRAAFVARSQQVNVAHNRYKCLCKHNDVRLLPLLSAHLCVAPPCTPVPLRSCFVSFHSVVLEYNLHGVGRATGGRALD